ncbi:hypothetical protein D3C79_960710 [compost metagenome]
MAQQGKLGDINAKTNEGFVVMPAHPTGGTTQVRADAFTGQHDYVYIPALWMLQEVSIVPSSHSSR